MNEKEFLFDIKLFASLRVKAATEAEARKILKAALDCATISCNDGRGGAPLVGEASDDGEAELVEVDGESV